MFKELTPLLTNRSLVLTLSSIGDDQVRVTITPRPTGKEEAKELAQPFAVEGTAEELDAGLSGAIVSYTAEHLTLERSVAQVKANMEAALKEVKDEAARKVAEARKSGKGSSNAKTEVAAKPEVKKLAPPSLFDASEESPKVGPDAAKEPSKAAVEEDNSNDSEEDGEENDSSEEQPGSTAAAAPAASVAAAAQSGMFDTQSEEDEILQEAFYGTDDLTPAA